MRNRTLLLFLLKRSSIYSGLSIYGTVIYLWVALSLFLIFNKLYTVCVSITHSQEENLIGIVCESFDFVFIKLKKKIKKKMKKQCGTICRSWLIRIIPIIYFIDVKDRIVEQIYTKQELNNKKITISIYSLHSVIIRKFVNIL